MIKAFVLRRKGLLNPPVCQGPRKVERNCAIVARRSRVIGRRNHQIPKAGLNVSGPRHRDWAVSAKRQRHHQIPADQGERSGVAEVHRLGFLSHAARVGTNGALPAPLPLDKRNTRSLIRVGWCGGMECRVGGEVSPGCLPIPMMGAHSRTEVLLPAYFSRSIRTDGRAQTRAIRASTGPAQNAHWPRTNWLTKNPSHSSDHTVIAASAGPEPSPVEVMRLPQLPQRVGPRPARIEAAGGVQKAPFAHRDLR